MKFLRAFLTTCFIQVQSIVGIRGQGLALKKLENDIAWLLPKDRRKNKRPNIDPYGKRFF